ncbi:hypothetical protein JQN72_08995 [Phycicoccus sp. CSK15P-2]|uniref:hypothetical protein n=1 Tax=Phycicoccus sp. CSK15P-2 TaxID=2807627 RepID=UPI00194E3DB2|nr:hypothetical protein [Phycicoccus sp. CSK15P-2]MBM6404374.1 hypothetical protein [Phycicoccus sp. CSK15P-2]
MVAAATGDIPSRFLVIDAERYAVARMYADHGFTPAGPLDEGVDPETGLYERHRRLVAKTSSIAKALEEARSP